MRSLVLIAAASVSLVAEPASSQTPPARDVSPDSAQYAPDVMAAARQDVLGLRECYDRAPRGAWRDVRYVTLVLAANGSVRDLRISPNGTAARAFRDCMLPIVRAWHFPAPSRRAELTLTYPAQDIRAAVEQIGRTG